MLNTSGATTWATPKRFLLLWNFHPRGREAIKKFQRIPDSDKYYETECCGREDLVWGRESLGKEMRGSTPGSESLVTRRNHKAEGSWGEISTQREQRVQRPWSGNGLGPSEGPKDQSICTLCGKPQGEGRRWGGRERRGREPTGHDEDTGFCSQFYWALIVF